MLDSLIHPRRSLLALSHDSDVSDFALTCITNGTALGKTRVCSLVLLLDHSICVEVAVSGWKNKKGSNI
jgi:hypothetical protein